MAKKLTRKEKIALQQQTETVNPKPITSKAGKKSFGLKGVLGLIVTALAFFLYVNTVNHRYVLDDFGLIKENTDTKKGISAIPTIFSTSYRTGMNFTDNTTYRPLSKAMFAVEWQMAPNNPSIGHWMNVIFFALSCWLLFHVLTVFMKGNLLVPFVTALLFASHPLHTEVVANIKSRDEILCFMFCIATSLWAYRHVITKQVKYLVYIGITFLLALMSKESAVTWIVVIPLILYFFTNSKISTYAGSMIMIFIPTVVFMIIRHNILGVSNNPIPIVDNSLEAIQDALTQKTTAIYLMGYYLKLFFYPNPLTCDASFNTFPPVGPTDWRFLLSFVAFAGMLIYAIVRFRKKDLFSFAVLYFFATASIVSNVLFLIGTNYGERLMYIPSLAFCLSVALLLNRVFKMPEVNSKIQSVKEFVQSFIKPISITAVIVLLFGVKTFSRNIVWYNDDILFKTDILTVPYSAHMLYYLANHLSAEEILDLLPDSASKQKQTLEAIDQLSRCVTIFPKYADAFQRRGYLYYMQKDYKASEPDYLKSLELNNTNAVTHNNYGNLLFNTQRFNEAMDHFKDAVKYNPKYAHGNNNLASVNGVYGMSEMQSAEKDPANREQHLANARNYFDTAIKHFKKAIEIDPDYAEPYRLLSVTYKNIGDEANSDKYAKLAEKVKIIEENNKKAPQ